MPANILLIEDDNIIAEDIRGILSESGHNVVAGYPDIFSGGEEFPDNIDRMIAEHGIGLILMDIHLRSQLDGVDLVKHIHRKSDIPVIYISGASRPETVLRARETEPYAYLLKPFSATQLQSQVEMTLSLFESSRRKRAALDVKTGVWQLHIGEAGLKTSFSWLVAFGYPEGQVQTEADFFRIIYPEDLAQVKTALTMLRRKLVRQRAFEYRIVDPQGQTRWVLSRIVDARKVSDAEYAYTLLSLDVTRQKQREEILVHDSMHDSLTELLNRKAFMNELSKLLRETNVVHRNFAVIFSDLDNFKQVNDDYGHEAGDELLKKVAARFQQAIKRRDTIARFGGDEFAFIVRDLKKPADIHAVARRIVESIQVPIAVGDAMIRTSVSLGIALPEAVSGDARSLLRNADKAMYHAKKDKQARYWLYRHNLEMPATETRH